MSVEILWTFNASIIDMVARKKVLNLQEKLPFRSGILSYQIAYAEMGSL